MSKTNNSGFAHNELLMATGILVTLVAIGFGTSWVLGLKGRATVVPAALLVGAAAVLVVGMNILDAGRRR